MTFLKVMIMDGFNRVEKQCELKRDCERSIFNIFLSSVEFLYRICRIMLSAVALSKKNVKKFKSLFMMFEYVVKERKGMSLKRIQPETEDMFPSFQNPQFSTEPSMFTRRKSIYDYVLNVQKNFIGQIEPF